MIREHSFKVSWAQWLMTVKGFTERNLHLMFQILEFVCKLVSQRIIISIVNKLAWWLANTILKWNCPNDIMTVKSFTERILHSMFWISEYVCWIVSHRIITSIVNKPYD